MVPNLHCFGLQFSYFTMVQNAVSRKHTSNFEFGSSPWLAIHSPLFSGNAEQQQPAHLCQPYHHEDKLILSQPCCIHTTIPVFHCLCFSLSVQYPINYMSCSLLYYKIGFVLHYFAQPWTSRSILGMVKLG